MTKLLSLVWYKVLPAKYGGQKGIACFNQSLGKLFPLVCLCSADNEPPSGLSYPVYAALGPGKKQLLKPFVSKKIGYYLSKEQCTHLLLEHPYYGFSAVKACRRAGVKLIVHSHNIEFQRFRQLGKWWWPLLKLYEQWVHRNASLSIFKTALDCDYAIRHFGLAPAKCTVIPFCTDRPVLTERAGQWVRMEHNILAEEKILLFPGTLDYMPNAKAVTFIYEKLAPELDKTGIPYRIIICGRNKEKKFAYLRHYHHPSVIMAGEKEDIGPYFSAASVFINPVQSGGGIQTKNIEALSYGLPVVCYEATGTGIPPDLCGGLLLLAEDDAAFMQAVIKALREPAGNLPAAFFDTFSWDYHTKKLAEKITRL
jgi:polysaccharide biosynthesis protein PslH